MKSVQKENADQGIGEENVGGHTCVKQYWPTCLAAPLSFSFLPHYLLSITLAFYAPNNFYQIFCKKRELYEKNVGQGTTALVPIKMNEHYKKLKQGMFYPLTIVILSIYL